MEERRIAFETARLAKDKEFGYDFNKQLPEYVPMFYCESDNDDNLDLTTLEESECQGEDIVRGDFYFRSTQSLLHKWLREVHRIDVQVLRNKPGYDEYRVEVYKIVSNLGYIHINIKEGDHIKWFPIYEDAFEAGLEEALKLI
jgi:hypothetical protein